MPSAEAVRYGVVPAVLDERSLFDPRLRYSLAEDWTKLPQDSAHVYPTDGVLATTLQSELLAYTRSNKDWLLGGTNIATNFATACIFAASGGIDLTSLTTASDQAIVSPLLLNSVQQSAWGGTSWLTTRALIFRTLVSFISPTATDVLAHIKLALTNALDTGTDNDQVGVRLDSATNSTGALIPFTSIGGTDADITPYDTFVPVTSVNYEITIALDAARYPYFYIDRRLWAKGSTPLTATLSGGYGVGGLGLAPVFGVQCVTTVATRMQIRHTTLSRTIAAP